MDKPKPPLALFLGVAIACAAPAIAGELLPAGERGAEASRSGLPFSYAPPRAAEAGTAKAAEVRPQPGSGTADPMPLAPPSRPTATGESSPRSTPRGSGPSWMNIAASLAVVFGLFLIAAWMMRRTTPGTSALLPPEVLEVLGRTPLTARHQAHLVRLGNKLVLLSIAPDRIETLSEITDPAEVDRLAGLCRQSQPNSSTAAFRQVLGQLTAGKQVEKRHG